MAPATAAGACVPDDEVGTLACANDTAPLAAATLTIPFMPAS